MNTIDSETKKQIKLSAELCQLVYEYSADQNAGFTKLQNIVPIESKYVKWFDIKSCDCQALAIETQNELYISFQGSVSKIDWLINFWMDLKDIEGGHIHSGFYKAAKDGFPIIGKYITEFVGRNTNGKVIITGHSLGGAMALVYSHLLKKGNPSFPIQQLVTFGQPRCGNAKFVNQFSTLNIDYFRFVNSGDYITDVPPPSGKSDWSHCGKGYILDEGKVLPYDDIYEKNLPMRLWNIVFAFFQLLWSKKVNKTELGKLSTKHSMLLYLKNISSI